MPPKRVEKKGKPAATPVLNNTRNAQKEIAVIESLHKAETHQLTSFIKTRSMELDSDIQRLQNKLKLSGTTNSDNDHLSAKTAGLSLAVSGKGLGRVSLDRNTISEYKEEPIKTGPARFDLDPSKTKTPVQTVPITKDHLVLLLARIKLSEFNKFSCTVCNTSESVCLFRNGGQQPVCGGAARAAAAL